MRKRNHTVTIRMNKEEYDLFQSKVKESGRTQQEVVIKAIADLKIASTEEVEELKRLNQMFADILSQLRGATTNINQISKEGLENEFDRNRQKARDSANRDSRADEELRNYYRELDAAIADTRGITNQAQSGEGYSRTEFRESERVHANTEKADTDTGRRETDDLIRQAEIARRSSEINRRNSASDNRTVRNAEAESIASAEQRRSEKQKWINEQERARAARRRNKRRSGPEL